MKNRLDIAAVSSTESTKYLPLWEGGSLQSIFCKEINRVKLGQAMDSLEWYAIKMMKEHQVNSQEKLSYFMNEVRLLSQCCLPSIVEIISVSISGIYSKVSGGKKPAVYYVMRYAKYGDIFRHVRETGRFPEVLARTFFVQLIQGKSLIRIE